MDGGAAGAAAVGAGADGGGADDEIDEYEEEEEDLDDNLDENIMRAIEGFGGEQACNQSGNQLPTHFSCPYPSSRAHAREGLLDRLQANRPQR